MSAKKKGGEEAEVGAPAWMVTYGDMMTLLLCFFVLLLSFSSIHQSQFMKALGSLQGYLGIMVTHNMSIVNDTFKPSEVVQKIEASNLKSEAEQNEDVPESYLMTLAQELESTSEKKGIGGSIEIINTLNTLRIRIPVSFGFNQGSMTLKKGSTDFLQEVAYLIKNLPYEVMVEGHTDNVPIYSEKYESNWELSGDRALIVLQQLAAYGVPKERMSAVACGEFKPITSNETKEGREKNRRVELVIVGKYDQINR